MGVETLVAATLIGSATSAVGSIKRGNAAKKAAEYNARISERQARETEEQTRQKEFLFRIQADKAIGEQKVARGASGIRATGSAMELLRESFQNVEQDAMNIREEGKRQAQALREGATLDRMEGQAAQTASRFSAAGSLLSGGASAFMALDAPKRT